MFPSSIETRLGEREMLWEHEPQCFHNFLEFMIIITIIIVPITNFSIVREFCFAACFLKAAKVVNAKTIDNKFQRINCVI